MVGWLVGWLPGQFTGLVGRFDVEVYVEVVGMQCAAHT